MKSKEIIERKLKQLNTKIEMHKKSLRHFSDGPSLKRVFVEIEILRSNISLLEWILTKEP